MPSPNEAPDPGQLGGDLDILGHGEALRLGQGCARSVDIPGPEHDLGANRPELCQEAGSRARRRRAWPRSRCSAASGDLPADGDGAGDWIGMAHHVSLAADLLAETSFVDPDIERCCEQAAPRADAAGERALADQARAIAASSGGG